MQEPPETETLTPFTLAWELKHGTLSTLEPDEPIFVLRARDVSAPAAVDFWTNAARIMAVIESKLDMAAACATAMRNWRGHKHTPD